MKAGISIVPGTPVCSIEELLGELDQILIMSVNPGFGGQNIIPACLDKLSHLAFVRREKNYRYLLAVDGGITLENAPAAAEKGADIIIAGSAFFNASDKTTAVQKLKGFFHFSSSGRSGF
jgi:ribulose-phosphate 3-epimerase